MKGWDCWADLIGPSLPSTDPDNVAATPSAGRAWCDWNFPQLELAADQDLVEQLKGVDTLAGLEDFIDTWALDKLPALLQKHGLSCSESPARGELPPQPLLHLLFLCLLV